MSYPSAMDAPLDTMIETLTRQHPGWVRGVQWVARLHEEDGSPSEADIRLNRVLVWDGDQVKAEYAKTFGLSAAFTALDELTSDVPWTQLRAVTDRDGHRSVELIVDEPRRPADNAATDPYWRQVHDYLDLNRAAVDELVVRLRASGDLPGADAPEERRRGGVLGYFRRD